MSYQLKTGEDALFQIEDGAITLESRGGSLRMGNATNVDYGKVLRKILSRLSSSSIAISDAYVDSSRVTGLEIPRRRVINPGDYPADPLRLFTEMSRRMQHVGQANKLKHGNATKRLRIELAGNPKRDDLISLLDAKPVDVKLRSENGLPASVFRQVTAEAVWRAREQLLQDACYAPFQDSKDYDVLLEDGQRLPPKALMAKALSRTLGFEVLPKHFRGSKSSPYFQVLKSFGYEIVPKGKEAVSVLPPLDDREWAEGDKRGRWHLRSERQCGLASAKRNDFVARHGKLYCEQCGMDPVKNYGVDGDACIEVHHARIAVADMRPGHKTKLEDLQCLCANCHRIEHQKMRVASRSTDHASKLEN